MYTFDVERKRIVFIIIDAKESGFIFGPAYGKEMKLKCRKDGSIQFNKI